MRARQEEEELVIAILLGESGQDLVKPPKASDTFRLSKRLATRYGAQGRHGLTAARDNRRGRP